MNLAGLLGESDDGHAVPEAEWAGETGRRGCCRSTGVAATPTSSPPTRALTAPSPGLTEPQFLFLGSDTPAGLTRESADNPQLSGEWSPVAILTVTETTHLALSGRVPEFPALLIARSLTGV